MSRNVRFPLFTAVWSGPTITEVIEEAVRVGDPEDVWRGVAQHMRELQLQEPQMKRKFTVAALRTLGMDGREWYDDWKSLPGSHVVDVEGHEGDVLVTFEFEGRFWQFTVAFTPGDWTFGNDLAPSQYVDDYEIEVVEVVKKQVTRYVPR